MLKEHMAQRFGRYWLQEKIGHGGMAEVFRATIGPDEKTYAFELAIKRLHQELQQDKAMVDMFLTEADIAKFLRHPNIVQVYEAGVIGPEPYIAMEYIWGTDLATLTETVRRRRLRFPADLAIFTGLQILRALDYVHRATTPAGEAMDLVHRDVTPSNIYVTFDGQVKLGDFGVARVSFLEERDDATIKGKAAYIPPEVLMGEPVDQRVDLWSLAVTMWEMMTARRMHEDATEESILSGAASRRIDPVSELNPDVPAMLAAIIQRALSFKPRRRQRDALTFYRELKFYLQDAGLQVTGVGLGRFVAGVMGREIAPQRSRDASTGVFERPSYQVPVGMSPTQRYQMADRRRRRAWPILVSLLLVLGGLAWWLFARPPPRLAPRVVASAPARREAPSLAAPAPEERDRPEALDFSAWEGVAELSAKGPARFEVLQTRGRAFMRQKKYAAAEESFKAALALRPRSITSMLGRANALIEMRSYAEAERSVRAAINVDPQNAYAYLLLGDILWMKGRDKEAREAYVRCIELDGRGKIAEIARRVLDKLP